MKSIFKKLIALAAVVLVFGVLALIDLAVSKSYKLEFLSVTRLSEEEVLDGKGDPLPEDWGVADGSTRMLITVRLTRGGKPVEGHTLYVKTNRNVLERSVTDGEGIVVINYRCYRASGGSADPITLSVRDENNSVFIFVPATAEWVINMVAPVRDSGSGMTTDDIFYDVEGGENGTN